MRKTLTLARATAALEQIEAYLAGGAQPEQEELREFLNNLALEQLLEEAGTSGQALLRAATVFELPVPETVLAALAREVGGMPARLRELGLLDPYRDVVEREVTALAVNQLVTGRLAPLSEAEKPALASLGLTALFAVWGGVDGSKRRPYLADIELARLGLLTGDVEVVASCAPDAVRGLESGGRALDGARMGRRPLRHWRPPAAKLRWRYWRGHPPCWQRLGRRGGHGCAEQGRRPAWRRCREYRSRSI